MSLIHIMGLALGLACFLLINSYVNYEKSYDQQHDLADHLVRLTTDNIVNNQLQVRDAMSFAPSGEVLEQELPEVIGYTTTYKTWRMIFRKDGQPIEEEWVVAADSNFLNLFHHKVLRGNNAEMLTQPYSMVLTESQASKYFGQENPIGKTLFVLGDFNRSFEVTGVIEDQPQNTHYKYDVLVSLGSFEERVRNDAWNGFNYYTYLLLDENADTSQIKSKLPALSRKYLGDESNLEFHIQPVKDIHLYSNFTFEPETHGSAKAVYFLSIISVLILIDCMDQLYKSFDCQGLGTCQRSGIEKSCRSYKIAIDIPVFFRSYDD